MKKRCLFLLLVLIVLLTTTNVFANDRIDEIIKLLLAEQSADALKELDFGGTTLWVIIACFGISFGMISLSASVAKHFVEGGGGGEAGSMAYNATIGTATRAVSGTASAAMWATKGIKAAYKGHQIESKRSAGNRSYEGSDTQAPSPAPAQQEGGTGGGWQQTGNENGSGPQPTPETPPSPPPASETPQPTPETPPSPPPASETPPSAPETPPPGSETPQPAPGTQPSSEGAPQSEEAGPFDTPNDGLNDRMPELNPGNAEQLASLLMGYMLGKGKKDLLNSFFRSVRKGKRGKIWGMLIENLRTNPKYQEVVEKYDRALENRSFESDADTLKNKGLKDISELEQETENEHTSETETPETKKTESTNRDDAPETEESEDKGKKTEKRLKWLDDYFAAFERAEEMDTEGEPLPKTEEENA